jgi:hypothetical protein
VLHDTGENVVRTSRIADEKQKVAILVIDGKSVASE